MNITYDKIALQVMKYAHRHGGLDPARLPQAVELWWNHRKRSWRLTPDMHDGILKAIRCRLTKRSITERKKNKLKRQKATQGDLGL